MTVADPLLEVRGVSKAYGGVRALEDASLDLVAGEVHALVGENGAGKSTLIKILSGAVTPDAGTVRLNGTPLRPGDVAGAEAAGIVTIHQEAATFPNQSVADNIFVGREPRRALGLLDRGRMRRETLALLERIGLNHVRPEAILGDLSLADRQMVAIARALSRGGRVLILDEPTASLSHREADALFGIVRRLKAEGFALLYVSHRMDEIFDLAERVTVLRDGRHVETCAIGAVDRESLIRKMVGRDIAAFERDDRTFGDVVLDVRNLSRPGAFADVSFSVRAGEIVGMGGLVGAGRSEVAEAIFGADRAASGTVTIDGTPVRGGSIAEAIGRGIALVPEDRQHLGLVLPLSVHDNLILATLRGLARSGKRESETVAKLIGDLSVRAASPALPAESLSGGNQQKLVIGKWLASSPRLLILDEPTRGVDVGAKAEIYRLIRQLAREGLATLLISSDLPELLALSDRIIVMRQGRLAGELGSEHRTEEGVLAMAFGEAAA